MALDETIGVGKGSVTLDDLHAADLILVLGQNPGTNHPRMLSALETAKRNGAHLVAVNPLPEAGLIRFKNPQHASGLLGAGTALADLFLQIRVNGDLALFQWLNRRLLEEDAVDHAFIDAHTAGFDAFAAHVRDTPWDSVSEATGLSGTELTQTLEMVRDPKAIIVCWAMGLTQHRNAVATIREIVNFLLLRGNIGRPGAGVCPVRGHSNVQGDRTMGIWERPTDAFLDRLGTESLGLVGLLTGRRCVASRSSRLMHGRSSLLVSSPRPSPSRRSSDGWTTVPHAEHYPPSAARYRDGR